MIPPFVAVLEGCREAEKEQTLRYRALAARAETSGAAELASRFQELHADEQHHLSRLTARLVELGHAPVDLSLLTVEPVALEGWEAEVRLREQEEVDRYERIRAGDLDPRTRALVEEILEVERRHLEELGGKWTLA